MSSVKYRLLPDGGFVAGDPVTGFTCYAFPSSPFAQEARTAPAEVAAAMVRGEPAYARVLDGVRRYDARNWAKLNLKEDVWGVL